MNVFSATYTDEIKFNRKPNEDYFLVSSTYPIFTVADGVTETPRKDSSYPYPGGARAAAQIFCNSVMEYMEAEYEKEDSLQEETIQGAFYHANDLIGELNRNEGMTKETIDFSERDFFDCVGVVGAIRDNVLTYGYLSDCGLAIFTANNQARFQVKNALHHFEKIIAKQSGLKAKKLLMQKEYRNRPDEKGYGAFTGESSAALYYVTGTLAVEPSDLIVLYSDGFEPYLELPEVITILREGNQKALDTFTAQKAKEDPEKFGTDRTVVAVQIS